MDGTNETIVTNETQNQNVEIDYSKIEGMINKGMQQKENSILKSYFEQMGLSEDEAKTAMSTYKENKAKAEAKKANQFAEMQKENEKLKSQIYQNNLEKIVKEQADILEVDNANLKHILKLADFSKIKDEKGEISAENVKAAIEAVLTEMPFLKREEKKEEKGFQNIGPDKKHGDAIATEEINRKRAAMGLKPL